MTLLLKYVSSRFNIASKTLRKLRGEKGLREEADKQIEEIIDLFSRSDEEILTAIMYYAESSIDTKEKIGLIEKIIKLRRKE